MLLSRHTAHICTLGATGHGKTAVTRALLKRLNPSELDRDERVVRSSHYAFRTDLQHFHHYDPAGNWVAKYLANHASAIDGAILVVSAVDGVTPETRHHVHLAQFCNVRAIIPFMNKCDLSDDNRVKRKCATAVAELLSAHGFRVFDVFPCGACASRANEGENEASLRLLVEMMDRHFRSRHDSTGPRS